jgi:hypothetical protein
MEKIGFGLRAETELTFLLFPGNRQLAGKSADGQIGWRAGFRISLLGASPPGGACARPFTPRITPACSRCLSRRGRIPGSSQRELADRLGKPQSFVAKVERGERRIDVIEFIAIAKAIGRDRCGC